MTELKIGTLAERTGVSVRTLHYYEEIGLLSPARRTASNHRLYTQQHIEQLLKIRTLQQLGFELDTIKTLLKQPSPNLLPLLQARIQHAQSQRHQLNTLCAQLETIIDHLHTTDHPSVDHCIQTLEAITMTDQYNNYYTQEQLDTLAGRLKQYSSEDIKNVESAWKTLFDDIRDAIAQGVKPEDPESADYVTRYTKLLNMFSGGDANIEASAQRVWDDHGDTLNQTHNYNFNDPALTAFIQDARNHHPPT